LPTENNTNPLYFDKLVLYWSKMAGQVGKLVPTTECDRAAVGND